MFRLGLAQFRPEKGDVGRTLDKLGEVVRQGARERVDLMLFPESATSGYVLEGAVEELAQRPESLRSGLEGRLGGLERSVDVCLGFYEQTTERPFNSAGYFECSPSGVALRHVYRKFFLPTYNVFDEARFHQEGGELGLVETRFGRMGILICEDVWHSVLPTLLAVGGAHTLLVCSASPARGFSGDKPGNLERYERMLTSVAEEHGLHVAMSMLSGFEGGKGLVGGSLLLSPFGEVLAQGSVLGEELLVVDVDPELTERARARTPLLSDLRERWRDVARLVSDLEV